MRTAADNDAAFLDFGKLMNPGQGVGRPFDRHRGRRAAGTQRADHRRGFPVSVRRRVYQPTAALATAAQPRHVCFRTDFIDETEAASIDVTHFPRPRSALSRDVRTILLCGPQRLFFRRYPGRRSVLNTVTALHETPVRARNSSNVASLKRRVAAQFPPPLK